MSLALKDIPGLSEMLAETREIETATREEAWIGMTRRIAGERIRVMTVRDYTALLQFESPMVQRALPTPAEFAFFLWVLSPEMERWHNQSGWRRWQCFARLQQWQSKRHGRRVRAALQLDELKRQESDWHQKSKLPFTLPDDAPFAIAIKEAFAYIDEMFQDKPAGLKKETGKSGLCYLTSWFDLLQSEYHLPTYEIWAMRIPVLFGRLKAIQMRHNHKAPEFNVDRDKILQNIMAGLNQKKYTMQDLRGGRVDLHRNCLRNN